MSHPEFLPPTEPAVAPEIPRLLAPVAIGNMIERRHRLIDEWCAQNEIDNRDDLTIRDKADMRTVPGWQEAFELAQLESLPYHLGFKETAELLELKNVLIGAAVSGEKEEVAILMLQYRQEATHLIDEQIVNGVAHERALIGFNIAMGIACRDIGNVHGYIDGLGAALAYADFRGYTDLGDTIAAVLTNV